MNGGIERVEGPVAILAGRRVVRQHRARGHLRPVARLLEHSRDLAVDIAPFTDPPEGEEALPAEFFQFVHAARPVGAVVDCPPDV